jgi:hypothetical protein
MALAGTDNRPTTESTSGGVSPRSGGENASENNGGLSENRTRVRGFAVWQSNYLLSSRENLFRGKVGVFSYLGDGTTFPHIP